MKSLIPVLVLAASLCSPVFAQSNKASQASGLAGRCGVRCEYGKTKLASRLMRNFSHRGQGIALVIERV